MLSRSYGTATATSDYDFQTVVYDDNVRPEITANSLPDIDDGKVNITFIPYLNTSILTTLLITIFYLCKSFNMSPP